MKRLLIVSSLIIFISCSKTVLKKNSYVVLRDVPENPAITVIPTNYSSDQINYANIIEETIIGFGVKVVTPPTIKEVLKTEEASLNKAETTEMLSMRSKGEFVAERYFSYGDFDADYIVFTDFDNKRIKIVKKETREVLTSFNLDVETEIKGSESADQYSELRGRCFNL